MKFIFEEKKSIILLILLSTISFLLWNKPIFGSQEPGSDASYYDTIAVNILNGNGFTYNGEYQNLEPGYPLFLAGIYSIFGHNLDAVRFIQCLLYIFTVLLTYFLTKKLFGRTAAIITGLFLSISYAIPLSGGLLYRETLTTFSVVLSVFSLYKLYEMNSVKWAIFSGLALGLLNLSNGITRFLFIPVIILFFLIHYRKKIIFRNVVLSIIILVFYLTMAAPAMVSNYKNTSSIGLAQRGGGLYARAELMDAMYHQYLGHLLGFTFGYYFSEKIYPDIDVHAFRRAPKTYQKMRDLKEQGLDASQIDKILFEEGLQKILASPHKQILTSLLDLISFNSPLILHRPDNIIWRTDFMHRTFTEGHHPEIPEAIKVILLLGLRFIWYAFLGFALYMVFSSIKKDWRKLSFIMLFVVYFNVLYSLIHAIPRYSIPMYPLYAMLFSAGLLKFFNKYSIITKIKILINR